MKSRKAILTATAASVAMLLLILDSKTALKGAYEGIELCIRSVIPSLFPFFVLSTMLTASLSGSSIWILRPIGAVCGIPQGMEFLLAIGLLGGYPVGAQNIYHAYKQGSLSPQQARRMLGFCNNAGPAFIFGIAGGLFHSQYCTWILWGIHILSAITVGIVLPQKNSEKASYSPPHSITLAKSVSQSIKTMSEVCAWIILFRVVISILQRWLLWLLPDCYAALICGSLELVNGCHFLKSISSEGTRFVLCAAFLAFGGGCVGMQTLTVTKDLAGGWYFPGKILQCFISILLALPAQYFLYEGSHQANDITLFGLILAFLVVLSVPFAGKLKKRVAFQRELVYNR